MPGSGEEEGQYLEQVLEHLRAVETGQQRGAGDGGRVVVSGGPRGDA